MGLKQAIVQRDEVLVRVIASLGIPEGTRVDYRFRFSPEQQLLDLVLKWEEVDVIEAGGIDEAIQGSLERSVVMPSLRQAVPQHGSGGETPAQLPAPVQGEREEAGEAGGELPVEPRVSNRARKGGQFGRGKRK